MDAVVVISVVVFIGGCSCLIVGEQLADRSTVPPALAMWIANIIIPGLAMVTARPTRRRTLPEVAMPRPAG